MSRFDYFCNLILEVYGGKKIVSASGNDGTGKTEVTYSDGSKETLTGSRPVRNNNPGNLEFGDFAKKHGAVGSDGRYAVFPDVQTGTNAQVALLKLPVYQNLSLLDAIHRYAPPSEGNNASYPQKLSQATGIPLDTKMSSLSPDQFSNMVIKMQKIEGFDAGSVNVIPNQQYADTGDSSQQPPEAGGQEASPASSQLQSFTAPLATDFSKAASLAALQNVLGFTRKAIEQSSGKKMPDISGNTVASANNTQKAASDVDAFLGKGRWATTDKEEREVKDFLGEV